MLNNSFISEKVLMKTQGKNIEYESERYYNTNTELKAFIINPYDAFDISICSYELKLENLIKLLNFKVFIWSTAFGPVKILFNGDIKCGSYKLLLEPKEIG